jgi:hypothetical protein
MAGQRILLGAQQCDALGFPALPKAVQPIVVRRQLANEFILCLVAAIGLGLSAASPKLSAKEDVADRDVL